MAQPGFSWLTEEFPDPSIKISWLTRNFLTHPGISPWNFLAHPGISWLTQEFPSPPRNFLAHHGFSWLTQEFLGYP